MSSSRLAFLTLSLTAHAALYLTLGGPAAGEGGKGKNLQQPGTVAVRLVPETLSVPEREKPSASEVVKPPRLALHPDGTASAAQVKNASAQVAADLAGAKDGETAMLPILPPAEPHYFSLGELTQAPRIEKDPPSGEMMALPETAPRKLVMHLLINEQGGIDKAELEDASSVPASLVRMLEESFSRLEFQPGKQGEQSVKTRMDIEINLDDILHIGQAAASLQQN